jgi:putative redox protein
MKQRGIPTEGSGITMTTEVDPERGMVGKVGFELHLPPEFPEKYEQAVVRAVEQCTVKRHLHQPPEFAVTTSRVLPD